MKGQQNTNYQITDSDRAHSSDNWEELKVPIDDKAQGPAKSGEISSINRLFKKVQSKDNSNLMILNR